MNTQYPNTDLEEATQRLASWLKGINHEKLKSRANFCRALADLRSRIVDDDLLATAVIKTISNSLESINGIAFCLTDHCDEFAESVQDLFDEDILQAHAELVHTLERHVIGILQGLDRQRALAMVLAETIGAEYTAPPIVN